MEKPRRYSILFAIVGVLLLVATIYRVRQQRDGATRPASGFQYEPAGIMGTSCRIISMGIVGDFRLQKSLLEAEAQLRRVEALMSAHMERTELSNINAAGAGEPVAVSAELLALLERCRDLATETDGAFDVTCGPLLALWKDAGRAGRLPEPQALVAAKALVGWDRFRMADGSVTKDAGGAWLDLGGIAKGYGIDRAIQALRAAGASGGLVDVGGDLRCFGLREDGTPWRLGVQDPFGPELSLELELTDKAVATSGDYQRYVTIDGKRYSHIVDPRSGRPVEGASSVTVIADDATTADAWATALSVLGPEGFRLAEAAGVKLEALIVSGGPDRPRIDHTPGFPRLVVAGWPPRSMSGPAASSPATAESARID